MVSDFLGFCNNVETNLCCVKFQDLQIIYSQYEHPVVLTVEAQVKQDKAKRKDTFFLNVSEQQRFFFFLFFYSGQTCGPLGGWTE